MKKTVTKSDIQFNTIHEWTPTGVRKGLSNRVRVLTSRKVFNAMEKIINQHVVMIEGKEAYRDLAYYLATFEMALIKELFHPEAPKRYIDTEESEEN
jgi:hypothetical protein